jgi:hypothetical protein
MPVESTIFDLIDKIKQMSPPSEPAVSQLFHVPLKRRDDPGNPYIKILIAEVEEPSPVEKLELRLPVEGTNSRQALLILTIRSTRAFPIAEVRKRFGPTGHVETPRAAAPFGTPTYESYMYPRGRLTFGYLPADRDLLRLVILDEK